MAIKKKSEKQAGSWIGEVEKYSRQIWLAGLGAYSKVSKDGTKLFDTLVKDGERAEKEAKNNVDEQAAAQKPPAGSGKSRIDEVKDRAIGKWGKLEEAFDKRLNNAISRLGVPSRDEVKSLSDKVELLTRQLQALTEVSAKPAAPSTAAKPVRKAAAGKATKPVAAGKTPASKAAAAKPAPAAPDRSVGKAAGKPAVKAPRKPASKLAAQNATASVDATAAAGNQS